MNHEDLKGRKPAQAPNTISARQAAELIELIRQALVLTPDETLRETLVKRLGSFGIRPLVACEGEAHDPEIGGMIDNCSRCSPRWGLEGAPIAVGSSNPWKARR